MDERKHILVVYRFRNEKSLYQIFLSETNTPMFDDKLLLSTESRVKAKMDMNLRGFRISKSVFDDSECNYKWHYRGFLLETAV